jgi:hypothetical protein
MKIGYQFSYMWSRAFYWLLGTDRKLLDEREEGIWNILANRVK